MPYRMVLDRDAKRDAANMRRYDRTSVLDAAEQWLTHEPAKEIGTRIVALDQPAISQFRLRVGEFRVYYDVYEEDQEVYIVRIREKGRRTTGEVTRDEGC